MSDRITKIKLTSEQLAQIAKDLGVNNSKRIPKELIIKGTSATAIERLKIENAHNLGNIGIIDIVA